MTSRHHDNVYVVPVPIARGGINMGGLDYDSAIPLYHQLKEILIEQIRTDRMRPGDAMPTEADLQEDYGLSRTTVRKTLEELENEGIIRRRRGKRSVVSRPPIEEFLPRLVGLTEEMEKSGRKVHSKVLACSWVLPSKTIGSLLQVAEGEMVLQMIRLRHIDDEPVFYSESHFPPHVGLDVTDDFSGSLFSLLREKCSIRVIESEMTIDAVPAGSAEAAHLDVVEGVPLLRTTRVTFGADGKPVEYLKQLARPDRYRHQVRLKPE